MQNATMRDTSGKLDLSDLTLNTVALTGFSLKSLWDSMLLSRQPDESAVIFGYLFPVIVLFNAISLAFANGTTKSLITVDWLKDQRLDLGSLLAALLVLIIAGAMSVFLMHHANEGLMTLVGGEEYHAATGEFILYSLSWIPFQFCCLSLQNLARGFGLIKEASVITIAMVCVGSVFSPLLILGQGTWQGLGLNGVALSNGFIAFCICAAILLLFVGKFGVCSGRVRLAMRNLKEIPHVIWTSLASNVLVIVFIFSFTGIMSTHGADVMEGYTYLVRVEQIILVILMSVSTVAVPMVAMAHQRGQYHSVIEIVGHATRLLVKTGLALVAVFFFIVFFILAEMQTSNIGVAVMHNFASFGLIGYLFQGGLIFFGALLAIFEPRASLVLNVVRFLILGLPMMWLGNYIGGVPGLFLSVTSLNIIMFCAAAILLKRVFSIQYGTSMPIRP